MTAVSLKEILPDALEKGYAIPGFLFAIFLIVIFALFPLLTSSTSLKSKFVIVFTFSFIIFLGILNSKTSLQRIEELALFFIFIIFVFFNFYDFISFITSSKPSSQ